MSDANRDGVLRRARLGFDPIWIADSMTISFSCVVQILASLAPDELAAVEKARRSTIRIDEPSEYFVHGDLREQHGDYFCRVCDAFVEDPHFKTHSREVNQASWKSGIRTLSRQACRHAVLRGGDFEDNLIELTQAAELDALDAARARGDL